MSVLMILVYLVVLSLIWWVLNYAITNLPLPAPIKQYGTVIVTIVVVIIAVMFLLQLIGGGGHSVGNLRLM